MFNVSFSQRCCLAETWTMRKANEHTLQAAEPWFQRGMLRVSWTEIEEDRRGGVGESWYWKGAGVLNKGQTDRTRTESHKEDLEKNTWTDW